jgi:hypothetical protein
MFDANPGCGTLLVSRHISSFPATPVPALRDPALAGLDETQSPGNCMMIEEEMPGISLMASRRVATQIDVSTSGVASGKKQSVTIDHRVLADARERSV